MSKTNGPTAARIRGEIFGWSDDVVLEAEGVHRLSLVARAFCLMDSLNVMTLENEGRTSSYLSDGVAQALAQSARMGDWGAIGTLLEGLEALVSPTQRAEWPLEDIASSFAS